MRRKRQRQKNPRRKRQREGAKRLRKKVLRARRPIKTLHLKVISKKFNLLTKPNLSASLEWLILMTSWVICSRGMRIRPKSKKT